MSVGDGRHEVESTHSCGCPLYQLSKQVNPSAAVELLLYLA